MPAADPIENAFEKQLLILSCFSEKQRVLTPQELGRQLDLSPATVEELAESLIRSGCMQQDSSGAYRLANANIQIITVKDEN